VEGARVDGSSYEEIWRLDTNGAQTISGVPVGDARIALFGLTVNCDPVDTTQRTVRVPSADAVALAFTISCARNEGQLAFVVGSAPAIRHIYVTNVNGTGVRRLGDVELSSDEDPAWSRDGKKMAF